jgi:hypothetical protein
LILNAVLVYGVLIQLRLLREQLRQASDAVERDHDQRRKQSTIDFLSSFSARASEFRDIPELRRAMVSPYIAEPVPLERAETIRNWLNGFERLAAAVNAGAFDASLTRAILGTTFVRVWGLYQPWIETVRAEFGNEQVYKELENLSIRFKNEKSDLGQSVDIP